MVFLDDVLLTRYLKQNQPSLAHEALLYIAPVIAYGLGRPIARFRYIRESPQLLPDETSPRNTQKDIARTIVEFIMIELGINDPLNCLPLRFTRDDHIDTKALRSRSDRKDVSIVNRVHDKPRHKKSSREANSPSASPICK